MSSRGMEVTMQKISLQHIVSSCISLGNVINSISDHQSLVMVIGNGGDVTFSKQALHILSESHRNHPLEKLITSAAYQYHNETGIDCKIFIHLLKEIMIGARDMLTKLDEVQVRRLLLKESSSLMDHLPEIFTEIKAENAYISVPSDSVSFYKDLNAILLTFLESKFSLCIAKDLSKLMGEFIHNSISNWSHATDYLNYLESRFNVFCSKSVSQVSQSRILKGFILNIKLESSKFFTDRFVKFIIVWNLPRQMDGAVCIIEKRTLQLSHFWEAFVLSLRLLKSHGISAILTPDAACEKIRSLCLQNQMLIISGVVKEDIENIIFFSGISPLTFISDSIGAQNVRCLKSIQSVANYTHLEMLSDIGIFRPHHIFLCAQLDLMWKEYYEECRNCLKVLKLWINPEVHNFQLKEEFIVRKQSLILPCDQLMNKRNDFQPPVHGIALPLGLFEFSFWKALNRSAEKHILFPHLYFILNLALLKVLCVNWEIPVRCWKGEETFLKFIDKKKCSLIHPIEPLLIKEMQLYKILQLVKQLIRIDALLPSRH